MLINWAGGFQRTDRDDAGISGSGFFDPERFLFRRRGSSELGTDGLIYPSYIFTGPRLTKEDTMPGEQYRLLPGGGIDKIKK